MGIIGLEEYQDEQLLIRIHLVVVSLAVFASETYFVAQRVNDQKKTTKKLGNISSELNESETPFMMQPSPTHKSTSRVG